MTLKREKIYQTTKSNIYQSQSPITESPNNNQNHYFPYRKLIFINGTRQKVMVSERGGGLLKSIFSKM